MHTFANGLLILYNSLEMRGSIVRLRNIKGKEEILENSPYLITNPFDRVGKWHDLFGNDHAIHVEIGMGKGKFIVEQAILHPEINFIGIERFDTVLARALPKIPEGIKNLYIIRMNAISIDQVFDHEIDTIYLNFSDPWPKKRHALRRLSSPFFLEKYDLLFRGDPIIVMKTDNEALFSYSLLSLSQNGYVFLDLSLDLHKEVDIPNITTEYEEKFVKMGMKIYYVMATKVLSHEKS